MASIQQIQTAAARFVDNDLAPAFSGGERILVSGAAALMIANAANMAAQYATHPRVGAMGVYDSATGDINVDALYQAFAPKFGNEKIPLKLPIVGTIKIGKAEIDRLYQYVKEA